MATRSQKQSWAMRARRMAAQTAAYGSSATAGSPARAGGSIGITRLPRAAAVVRLPPRRVPAALPAGPELVGAAAVDMPGHRMAAERAVRPQGGEESGAGHRGLAVGGGVPHQTPCAR
jgi:hypothetical protein